MSTPRKKLAALLIRGGEVLDPKTPAFAPADVLITGDRIAQVGPGLKAPPGAEIMDAAGRLVLPGLINIHTHSNNNLLRAAGDNWTLEDLLNHAPALNGGRTPEDQYYSAAVGAVEMLKTGTTATFDLFNPVSYTHLRAHET